jgi:peptidoglycan/LPS O-acetylase OafA/YrhL
MDTADKTYFANLDSLRFFAFFAVFVNHAASSIGYKSSNVFAELFKYKYLSNGDLGVSFFFVLSGFLITYLLLQEKKNSGRINIAHFYMRRILRIWPVYFLVVLICLMIVPALQQYITVPFPMRIGISRLDPLLYLTFLGNFDFILHGISNSLIAVLWSVSVEEQFYLVWPLFIAFVPRKYLMPFFVGLILASLSYRLFLSGGKSVNIKFHTLSSLADLACGALLALLSTKEKFIEKIRLMPRRLIILIYMLGITLFVNRFTITSLKHHELLIDSLLPFLFTLFFAFIIMEQNFAERSVLKLGRLKLFSIAGKYTYGMYCYHMLVFFLVLFCIQLNGFHVTGFNKYEFGMTVLTSFVLTIMVSVISYKYLEKPVLRLKKKFSTIAAPVSLMK